ncbi:unnamed protein product [Ectocarpus sp. 6 AP-2014]
MRQVNNMVTSFRTGIATGDFVKTMGDVLGDFINQDNRQLDAIRDLQAPLRHHPQAGPPVSRGWHLRRLCGLDAVQGGRDRPAEVAGRGRVFPAQAQGAQGQALTVRGCYQYPQNSRLT